METPPRLGLRENASQFALLVLVNAFVGAMVGVERSVLPLLAEVEFGIASAAAMMSFLIAFGLAKAAANFVAGDMAGRIGRRRILLAGWLFGLPVPLLPLTGDGSKKGFSECRRRQRTCPLRQTLT